MKSYKVKLSIITINYNNCEALQKTVDSVICQTWRDFEWIIIDGGSTDGSKELITDLNDNPNANISYWCSEPDKGIYNAMNKGIAKAKGEYLQFLNSGDVLYPPTCLAEVFNLDIQSDIIEGIVLRSDNNKILQKYSGNVVERLIMATINHQGTFIKRSLFNDYLYREDFKVVSDWIAWIDWLIKSNHTYQHVSKVVVIEDMEGISQTKRIEALAERDNAMKELIGERLATELPRLYRTQYSLKSELEIPAIKGLRYLLKNAPLLFSLLYRMIMVAVSICGFFCRKNPYSEFE